MTVQVMVKLLGTLTAAIEGAGNDLGGQLANKLWDFFLGDQAEGVLGEKVGWLIGNIGLQVVVTILSAGAWAEASVAMKAIIVLCKMINWPFEVLGLAAKGLVKLAGLLTRAVSGLVKTLGKAGGALAREVIAGIEDIAKELGLIAHEMETAAKAEAGAARTGEKAVAEDVAKDGKAVASDATTAKAGSAQPPAKAAAKLASAGAKRVEGSGAVDLAQYAGENGLKGQQQSISLAKGWRDRLGNLTEGKKDLVYALRDADTGEILKVGRTESETIIGRLQQYATAGTEKYSGRNLVLDVAEANTTAKRTLGQVENEMRAKMLEDLRAADPTAAEPSLLPWDNSPGAGGKGRLGREGPGTPSVRDHAMRERGAVWEGEKVVEPTAGGTPKPAPPPVHIPLPSEVTEVLTRHAGNVTETAKELGVSRQVLYKWMERMKIDPDKFRQKED